MDDKQTDHQPETVEQPDQPTGLTSAPAKSNKKKLFIIGGLLVVVLALIGSGAMAYNLWYQNPDKVLSDSVLNAVQAKSVAGSGSFNFNHEDGDVKLTINNDNDHSKGRVAVSAAINMKDPALQLDAKGEGIYAGDGSLFVKISDLDKTYQQFADFYIDMMTAGYGDMMTADMKQQARSGMDEQFKPVIDKLNNQWIKIDSDSLKDVNQEAGQTQECVTDVLGKLSDDQAMASQVVEVYKDNKFVNIVEELGAKDGNLGYVVELDEAAAKKFGQELKDTDLGKELIKCDDSLEDSLEVDEAIEQESKRDERLEVWVSRWSHQLAEINYSSKSTEGDKAQFDFVYTPEFNQTVSVEAPKDFITVDELKDDFSAVMPAASNI